MMDKLLNIGARLLMSQIFIISGVNKILGYAGTQGYMEKMGVPGILLPLVILLEVGGGLALLFGLKTRWAAAALAGFTIIAALIFHRDFSTQMQLIHFMKNLAIAGGLLLFVQHGTAPSRDDHRLGR
jgi:putative oxidoreductase